MHLSLLPLAILTTTTLASHPVFKKSPSFAAMLARGALIARQDGYYPDTTACKDGATCVEACGEDSVECPSSSTLTTYCHKSTDGSHCCPDGSGKSCDKGFYCSSDGRGATYCCREDQNVKACADAYKLTVSLVRETSVVASATGGESRPAQTPGTTDAAGGFPGVSSLASLEVPASTGSPNITLTGRPTPTSTGSLPAEFTGGAGKVAGAGLAALAGAVGVARLL